VDVYASETATLAFAWAGDEDEGLARGACLEWSVGRALAAGATEDEIADVLVAIAPVTGLRTPNRMTLKLAPHSLLRGADGGAA
jgi:alkylhydroperoxidase/carboxymuconolactone decarboxylase family protein YurZ